MFKQSRVVYVKKDDIMGGGNCGKIASRKRATQQFVLLLLFCVFGPSEWEGTI